MHPALFFLPALAAAVLTDSAPRPLAAIAGDKATLNRPLCQAAADIRPAALKTDQAGADRDKVAPGPALSDPAYLTLLGLMRGHLDVGMELYLAGDREEAASHMRHPEQELYPPLENALAQRGVRGFRRRLEALARAVAQDAGPGEVNAAYRRARAAITKAEEAISDPSPYVIGQVIHELVRRAAVEYGNAVKGGKVVMAPEYQDGMGFFGAAEHWLKRLEGSGANVTVVNSIREQMGKIEPAWPSAVPPEKITVEPKVLNRAAAQIGKAAIDLKE